MEKTHYKLIDGHTHLNDDADLPFDPEVLYLVTATDHRSIDRIMQLENGNVIRFIGIHPWFIDDKTGAALTHIESILQNDKSVHIGETGLDRYRAKKNPAQNGLERQIEVFEEHLKLAVRYKRMISIHCVHAYDILFGELKRFNNADLRFIQHRFEGNITDLTKIIDRNGLVTFNPLSLGKKNDIKELIAFCPPGNLLIESDYMTPESDAILSDFMRMVSEIKNINSDKLTEIMLENIGSRLV